MLFTTAIYIIYKYIEYIGINTTFGICCRDPAQDMYRLFAIAEDDTVVGNFCLANLYGYSLANTSSVR